MNVRAVVAIIAVVVVLVAWKYGQYLIEDVLLYLNPNAEQAFVYGELHFDSAHHPYSYNIDRAGHLFQYALSLRQGTTTIPYLYHELARVAFLEGRFQTALSYINTQITLFRDQTPNSYYVRGLIEGYMHNYPEAIRDYGFFVANDPHNWAALNDYAWVLMMNDEPQQALEVASQGLQQFPSNPWLLNMAASALYRVGDLANASDMVRRARDAASNITEHDWLVAYPGNDPATAGAGIQTLKKSIIHNGDLINSVMQKS